MNRWLTGTILSAKFILLLCVSGMTLDVPVAAKAAVPCHEEVADATPEACDLCALAAEQWSQKTIFDETELALAPLVEFKKSADFLAFDLPNLSLQTLHAIRPQPPNYAFKPITTTIVLRI